MKEHMKASMVTHALRMAWFRRRPAPGLVFHSDRGSQYCGHEFQNALKGYIVRELYPLTRAGIGDMPLR